jgi:hypothetical protein
LAKIAARITAGPPAAVIRNEAEAKIAMAKVLLKWPTLTTFGLGVYDQQNLDKAEYSRQLNAGRVAMLDSKHLAQFRGAVQWLSAFPKIKSMNHNGSSYGLKHTAARYMSGPGGYSCNGVFIAAAIAAGFRIEPTHYNSPNARFNISTLAWKEPWRGARTAEGGTRADARDPDLGREITPVSDRVRELEPAE